MPATRRIVARAAGKIDPPGVGALGALPCIRSPCACRSRCCRSRTRPPAARPACMPSTATGARSASLPEVIARTHKMEHGGTFAIFLACDALRQGYQATIYTYNLTVFDPTWFVPGVDIAERLQRQREVKTGRPAAACHRGLSGVPAAGRAPAPDRSFAPPDSRPAAPQSAHPHRPEFHLPVSRGAGIRAERRAGRRARPAGRALRRDRGL